MNTAARKKNAIVQKAPFIYIYIHIYIHMYIHTYIYVCMYFMAGGGPEGKEREKIDFHTGLYVMTLRSYCELKSGVCS